jgi:hypothetical protein
VLGQGAAGEVVEPKGLDMDDLAAIVGAFDPESVFGVDVAMTRVENRGYGAPARDCFDNVAEVVEVGMATTGRER